MNFNEATARKIDASKNQYTLKTREPGRDRTAVAEQAGPQETVTHAVTSDQLNYDKAKPPPAEYLRHAQRKSGRGPITLAREYFRLKRGRGKLSLQEYVQFGVYDTTRHSPEEQSRFISNLLHWPITGICCDMTWQATTEDKWLCSHILAGSGIRTPETLAVIDKTGRVYPGTRKISTAAEFRDFARSQDGAPFFGKENRGICGFGAFMVPGADDTKVQLKGRDPLPYDSFMDQFVGDTPYLLQRLETNHHFFHRYTDNLATVRVCILSDSAGVRFPFAVLKLPSRENLADSFWRPGNLACDLDTQSGKIMGCRSVDPLGTTEHTDHPVSGDRLVGEVVPMWDRVLDLARNCALIFYPVRYQSMDIAVTQDGPVLVEINTGGGFDLPQLASGRGFLTDEVCDFFRACGYQDV